MQPVDWRSLEGFALPEEMERLEELCMRLELAKGCGLISCEVGSYLGRTAALFAQFGLVVAVDLGGDLLSGEEHQDQIGKLTFPQLLTNLSGLGILGVRVIPVCGTSLVFDWMLRQYAFDFVFVDGDHSFKQCFLDLWRCYLALKTDAVLVVHDYYPDKEENSGYGVCRALQSFLEDRVNRDYEFEVFESLAIIYFGKYRAMVDRT